METGRVFVERQKDTTGTGMIVDDGILPVVDQFVLFVRLQRHSTPNRSSMDRDRKIESQCVLFYFTTILSIKL
jgi:hypothetical protein